jgi:hypothetical protein
VAAQHAAELHVELLLCSKLANESVHLPSVHGPKATHLNVKEKFGRIVSKEVLKSGLSLELVKLYPCLSASCTKQLSDPVKKV